MKTIRGALWAAVLLGLLASLWSASNRWRTEARNRRVEITLDFTELRSLAASEGRTVGTVLKRFHDAGANAVALDEDTIGGLEGAHRLQVLPAPDRATTILRCGRGLSVRVGNAVAHKTRYVITPSAATDGSGLVDLTVNQPYSLVRSIGIGLDSTVADGIHKAGLDVVGRVANFPGVRSDSITWTLQQLHQSGATTVIFLGDEVLGSKGRIHADAEHPETATTQTALAAADLNYGIVEFGKQKGDEELERAVPERTLRVHTVPGSEMSTADIPGNVQRFLLAARERNIRMLFVRLFLSEPDTLETNASYIEKIARGLRRGDPETTSATKQETGGEGRFLMGHLQTGQAHGYGELHTPVVVRFLMGIGIAAGWLLLLEAITGALTDGSTEGQRLLRGFGLVTALVLLILPVVGTMGAKLGALTAACIFPALALLHRDQLRPDSASGFHPLKTALVRFAAACAITSIGIAAILGLLADRLFLIKVDAFIGIKGAQLVPVLLAVLVYALDLRAGAGRTFGEAILDAGRFLGRAAAEPIRYWQVGAALLALGLLAFMVMRSGNDPGVGVSGTELKIRALLDRFMPARPRFKEFVLGHPALILAFALAARGRRAIALPLFLVGAIGQVSLLNTFCHLHTPIPVGLTRALLGLIIGVGIGAVAYGLLDRVWLRRLPPAPAGMRP